MKGDFTRFTFDRRKHYSGIRMQQGRVQLDSDWNELVDIQAYRMRTESEDFIGPSGAPKRDPGFAIGVTDDEKDLTISPGRMYVDGILCENEEEVFLSDQTDLPGYSLPTEAGPYAAYLEVWHRHVTALEDPSLREVGLGGPDTATRVKTVWQVKLAAADDWPRITAPPTGKLKARVVADQNAQLRTSLYRVEAHRLDFDGNVYVKWSRNNAAIVARWLKSEQDQSHSELTIENAGVTLDVRVGDWIELIDDTRELDNEPGTLARVIENEGEVLTVKAMAELKNFPRNPRIRRWDTEEIQIDPDTETWIALEDGVEVQLMPGSYRPGDYWLIPARSFHRDVEWPRDGAEPLALPPHGIERHFARLALVDLDDNGRFQVREDARFVFSSLTDLKELKVVQAEINAPDGVLYVDTVGNVGIGTASPSTRLHVFKSNSGGAASVAGSTGNSGLILVGSDVNLDFAMPTGGAMGIRWSAPGQNSRAAISYYGSATSNERLSFRTGEVSDRMVITGSGRVGIGTTNPRASLHVNNPVANWHGFSRQLIIGGDQNVAPAIQIGYGGTATRWGIGHAYSGAGLRFFTADSDDNSGAADTRMYIESSGNIGIGTENPQAGLHVNNSKGPAGGVYIENKHTGGNTHFDYPDGKNYIRGTTILADTGGAVGIGTSKPERLLHVAGTIGATRTETHHLWTRFGEYQSSDLRVKEDVFALDDALVKVLALRGVRYTRSDADDLDSPLAQIGLVAQEVEPIFPEIVDVDSDGLKGINYGRLVAPLIEAVKKQQEQIEELKTVLKSLMAKKPRRPRRT